MLLDTNQSRFFSQKPSRNSLCFINPPTPRGKGTFSLAQLKTRVDPVHFRSRVTVCARVVTPCLPNLCAEWCLVKTRPLVTATVNLNPVNNLWLDLINNRDHCHSLIIITDHCHRSATTLLCQHCQPRPEKLESVIVDAWMKHATLTTPRCFVPVSEMSLQRQTIITNLLMKLMENIRMLTGNI